MNTRIDFIGTINNAQISGTSDDMELCTYFPKAQMNQKFNKDTP